MRILVTGASSYIAKAIIRNLCERHVEVLATYRSQRPNDLKGAKLLQLDLCDQSGFHRLPRRVDAIVHVAAGAPGQTVRDIIQSTVNGSLSLQQYALNAGAGTFLVLSSVSIHGRIEYPVLDETAQILEPSIYGASKLLVERILAATADHLPVLALRLPAVLGCFETETWIPSLMRKLLGHQDVKIFNPASAFNNAIDVDELARFVATSITNPISGFHAFPLASSGSMTVAGVVAFLRKAAKSRSVVTVGKASCCSFTVSSKYAKKFLGYQPIGIRETLNRFVRRVEDYNR